MSSTTSNAANPLHSRSSAFHASELERQQNTIGLIASENYASKAVREALGGVFTNKYSEGEPGKRYYQGNKHVDELEFYVNELVLKAFGLDKDEWHVNAKALSAAIANFCVETGLLTIGDKIMSMYLYDGGHLSHGWDMPDKRGVTVSSKLFDVQMYRVDKETHRIDYDKLEAEAIEFKPKMIITGGTAYPRAIDHKRIREICDKVGALYLADVAHEAGLMVGKAFPAPFPHADIVTFSTQKTLRGPRSSVIICRKEFGAKIARAIFPGLQGGPFDHHLYALAIALEEALTPAFSEYAHQVIKNAQAMADEFEKLGYATVSGGTDKHLVSLDLSNKDVLGNAVAVALEDANIVCNSNTVPHDKRSPFNPSGIRVGTAGITTRGMGENEAREIARLIDAVATNASPESIARVRKETLRLCAAFPIPDAYV